MIDLFMVISLYKLECGTNCIPCIHSAMGLKKNTRKHLHSYYKHRCMTWKNMCVPHKRYNVGDIRYDHMFTKKKYYRGQNTEGKTHMRKGARSYMTWVYAFHDDFCSHGRFWLLKLHMINVVSLVAPFIMGNNTTFTSLLGNEGCSRAHPV